MAEIVLILGTALGLAGLYFLLASGLSLIFGLMGVLNLAHGLYFTCGAFAMYLCVNVLPFPGNLTVRLVIGILLGAVIGALLGVATERFLIARFYGDPTAQIVSTIGLSIAGVALVEVWFGLEARVIDQPSWLKGVTGVLGARIPNVSILTFVVAALLFVAIAVMLRQTRHGLILRAGTENRTMVSAMGINVAASFTLVFAIGGLLAGVGGSVGALFFSITQPHLGDNLLIFAFIVVVLGGLGSFLGTALSALTVALTQQLLNYYGGVALGDLAVVGLMAAILLVRPNGLLGARHHAH